jgi:hypothetical protein
VAWPFNFRMTETEVQVRLGAWVVRRIRLDDIQGVRIDGSATFRTWGMNEHWCNFSPMRFVILRRKSGWVRSFIINPPDTEPFATELKQRIARTAGAF